MEEKMKQKVKLIMVDEKPYVVSLDKIEIGDKVIVTVGGQYPSILECNNELIYNIVVENKLSSNQAFKVFMEPDNIKFNPEQIEKILENDGLMDVELDEGVYKYSL
jgi:hypothetical protein